VTSKTTTNPITLISSKQRGSELASSLRRWGRNLVLGSFPFPFCLLLNAQERWVDLNAQGRLIYEKNVQGDHIPDFSSAGYRGGGVKLPVVPATIMLQPRDGDDGLAIQSAIDHLSSLEPDSQGYRGALLLGPGSYEIEGQLHLHTSGVVIRGGGQKRLETQLVATGQDRRALIRIEGQAHEELGAPVAITDRYVPVGATSFNLAHTDSLKVGERIQITRPSPQNWIDSMGMSSVQNRPSPTWKEGSLNILWERRISSIEENKIVLDAPLTCSLDHHYEGGSVRPYQPIGRIKKLGIENLTLISRSRPNHPMDEEHAWMAVMMDHAEDCWIRNVTAQGFVTSAVSLGEKSCRITVIDCQNLNPVSELGGYRRHAFHTAGQQTLFVRCFSEKGRHDFSTGWRTAGPNVFLSCETLGSYDFSGPTESWSTGVLMDNVKVDGGALSLDHREIWDNGVGWAAANSVFWQCSAPIIVNRSPPGSQNWAIGCWGQFVGNGHWRSSNQFVNPKSLYRQQLQERLGAKALDTLEQTSFKPETAPVWKPKPSSKKKPQKINPPSLKLANGWLLIGDQLAAGRQPGITWWRGHQSSSRAEEFGINLTRFAPGLRGRGLTDDLDELGRSLEKSRAVGLRHHPGLWYDRRRDDHEMIRRIDGDVWPPFYEQPWARSGLEKAWDGLSKYDLTKFNPWYFKRLHTFAEICHQRGLVFINAMYFQHNILEAGAHWADYPWRPANNINETGFPEPPPYANGKRIFMAEEFYDSQHPVRRPLHQAFIRHSLQNLKKSPNVIHLIGEEYSGPLSFATFWLDTVTQWSRENGEKPLIGLSVPKNVQDCLLADPHRSSLIDVIDFKYWWISPKGLFAPEGGLNLAPRQHERLWKGGRPTDETLALMATDYRKRFPEKAIMCHFEQAGWAYLCAGGSLPNLPATTPPELLKLIASMQPSLQNQSNHLWGLWGQGVGGLIYSNPTESSSLQIDLSEEKEPFYAYSMNLQSGKINGENPILVHGGKVTDFPLKAGKSLFWFRKAPVATEKN